MIEPDDFSADISAKELLAHIDISQLQQNLENLLMTPVRLTAKDGQVLLNSKSSFNDLEKVPIAVDFEPVAFLEANAATDSIKAAAFFLKILFQEKARYVMATKLHTEVVHRDYEDLQASEQRYKKLAENLEVRVAEQIKVIEKAQRKLYENEKMASVGQLAAGIAHEINNPIGFINNNLKVATDYLTEFKKFIAQITIPECDIKLVKGLHKKFDIDYILEDFFNLLVESGEGCQRIAVIVSDLRDFSNIDGNEWKSSNINKIIESVCNVSKGKIPEEIKVSLNLSELPGFYCQPGYLAQAFYNLLDNSIDALSSRESNSKISFTTELSDNKIIVNFSDNGPGIPDEIINKIFVPFFTTKPIGQGTGLGLTVCNDIIKTHDGEITVRSSADKGTTFHISLPISSKE